MNTEYLEKLVRAPLGAAEEDGEELGDGALEEETDSELEEEADDDIDEEEES